MTNSNLYWYIKNPYKLVQFHFVTKPFITQYNNNTTQERDNTTRRKHKNKITQQQDNKITWKHNNKTKQQQDNTTTR